MGSRFTNVTGLFLALRSFKTVFQSISDCFPEREEESFIRMGMGRKAENILPRRNVTDLRYFCVVISHYCTQDGLMDVLEVLRPINSISVTSGRWEGDYNELGTIKDRLGSNKLSSGQER